MNEQGATHGEEQKVNGERPETQDSQHFDYPSHYPTSFGPTQGGFDGRQLNGKFAPRASQDRSKAGGMDIQVTNGYQWKLIFTIFSVFWLKWVVRVCSWVAMCIYIYCLLSNREFLYSLSDFYRDNFIRCPYFLKRISILMRSWYMGGRRHV